MVEWHWCGCQTRLESGIVALGTNAGLEGVFVRPSLLSSIGEDRAMQPFLTALPVVSISAIFFVWDLYHHERERRRKRRLCERVAYLLWVASDYVKDGSTPDPTEVCSAHSG
jgi:hypothetical protein